MAPPRQRKPPTRYAGRAAAYHAATAEEHFRAIFFIILDNSMEQMRQRFDKSAQGICRYLCLEQALLLGKAEYELVSCYTQSLKRMPWMCNWKCFTASLLIKLWNRHKLVYRLCPEVRSLFSQTEQLVRLLLVCPASSCTAERSFSALRRLKTWLRNNMTQKRLNHVAVCHVHQDFLDSIDPFILAQEFAGRSEIRRNCSDPLAVHRSHSSIYALC